MSGTAASPPATTLRSALEAVDVSLLAPEPVTFTVVPGALRVVAGVDFEPAGAPFPDGHEGS